MSALQPGTSLAATLRGRRGKVVARGQHGTLALDRLLRQAAAIARALPAPAPGSEIAFAFERERAAFAAALLATWARGHAAALPEDAGREHAAPLLARPGNVGFLYDTGVGGGMCVPAFLAQAALDELLDLEEPALERSAAIGFRGPRSVTLRGRELLAVVDRLAASMELAPGELVACALAPTELASTLAALLAPLRAGALFCAEAPHALAESLREIGASTLVATPAQIRALALEPAGGLGSLARVFCLDAEPDARSAAHLRDRHGLRFASLAGLPLEDEEPERAFRAAVEALEGVREARVERLPGGAGLLVAVAAEATVAELEPRVARLAPAGARFHLHTLTALPHDANGRVALRRLFAICGRACDGQALERTLAWTPLPSEAEGELRFRTRLPARYAFFEGHFPGHPVLPGAAQVQELVLAPLRRAWPELANVRRLVGLKFLARILPGDELELALRRDPARPECTFELSRGGERCSAGRIEFRPPGGERAP